MELRLYNGKTIDPFKIIHGVVMIYTMDDGTLIYRVCGNSETESFRKEDFRYFGVYPE